MLAIIQGFFNWLWTVCTLSAAHRQVHEAATRDKVCNLLAQAIGTVLPHGARRRQLTAALPRLSHDELTELEAHMDSPWAVIGKMESRGMGLSKRLYALCVALIFVIAFGSLWSLCNQTWTWDRCWLLALELFRAAFWAGSIVMYHETAVWMALHMARGYHAVAALGHAD